MVSMVDLLSTPVVTSHECCAVVIANEIPYSFYATGSLSSLFKNWFMFHALLNNTYIHACTFTCVCVLYWELGRGSCIKCCLMWRGCCLHWTDWLLFVALENSLRTPRQETFILTFAKEISSEHAHACVYLHTTMKISDFNRYNFSTWCPIISGGGGRIHYGDDTLPKYSCSMSICSVG